jgi:hypothetical protein
LFKGYTLLGVQGIEVLETTDTSRPSELPKKVLKFAAQLDDEESRVLADLVHKLRME